MNKKICTFLACALLLTACKTNGRQISATYDPEVYRDYMTESNDIDNLNYLVTDKQKNLSLLGNLIDGLVETDRYGNLKPAMAQDVGAVSDDAKVWDFSIRGDVPWVDHEGKETGYYVTADDFICAIEYVLNDDHQSSYQREVASLLKNGEKYLKGEVTFDEVGIEAINDYTLRFTLAKSCSYFNTYLLNGGFYPICRTLLNEVGDDFATAPDKMWYNGAYYLNEYSDQNIVFEKNETYWEIGQVSFEKGTITRVADDNEALELFKKGDLSYAFVDEAYAEKNGSSIDSHMYMSAVSPESYVYVFNFSSTNKNTKKALANEDFRKAIFYGFNVDSAFVTKESSVEAEDRNKTEQQAQEDTVNKKQVNASVQSTIIPNGFVTRSDGADYVTLGSLGLFSGKSNYDAEAMASSAKLAMDALSQEGVTFPVEIKIPVNADHSQEALEINRMTEGFDDTFVTFTLIYYTENQDQVSDDVVYMDDLMKAKNYDLLSLAIHADNGDPSTYLGQLCAEGSINAVYSHFKDEVYESLYASANQFTDNDKRLMSFAECEAYLLNKAYVIPFSHGKLSYKVSSINDYTMPSGTYGLAHYKLKGVKATETALTVNERLELKAAYEEAKSSAS